VTAKLRCRRLRLLGAAIVAIAGVQFAPAAAAAGGNSVVLRTFHPGDLALDLAIARCRSSECPVQVRLLRQGRVVDRVTLPVAADSQQLAVQTDARVLTVAPRTAGLLVTQTFGSDQPRAQYHLFILPRDGKLRVVWKVEADQSSPIEIVPGSAHEGQDIVYFHGVDETDENGPDRLDVVRLSWDAASLSFRETPLPDRATPLYLLNLGVYATIAQARRVWLDNYYSCPLTWILDARRFPGVGRGGEAIIGMLYVSRASAEEAARTGKECVPSATPSVLEWTGPSDPQGPAQN
jgi:hypothetical protein